MALTSFSWLKNRHLFFALTVLLIGDLFWTFQRFPSSVHPRIIPLNQTFSFHAPVLVLGAALRPGKEPTYVLQERLITALRLYREKKVSWFLVSGDNRSQYYNEPQAMRNWLIREGVPHGHIICDYAGRRTYDSIKRARSVFGLHKIVIVTSDFHLPRAIFIAQHLGLEPWGVASSTETHATFIQISFWIREYVARHIALLDVWFPPDTLLGPVEKTPEPDEANRRGINEIKPSSGI